MSYYVHEIDGVEWTTDITALDELLFVNGGRMNMPDLTKGHWWVIENHDGELAGFAGMHVSRYYKKTSYLCRAGVAWKHRGKGLQKRLIRARLKKARQLGWDWVVTDTERDNYASANSLIGCGFKLFKPSQSWALYRNGLYWGRML